MKIPNKQLGLFVLIAIVATINLVTICTNPGQIKVLSGAQLAKLQGGVLLCKGDCLNKNCECQTNDCEDIECSPCTNGSTSYRCIGNDGDTADVTACYQTSNSSDSCTPGSSIRTNCEVDRYTTSNCSGSPDAEDLTFFGNDCMT